MVLVRWRQLDDRRAFGDGGQVQGPGDIALSELRVSPLSVSNNDVPIGFIVLIQDVSLLQFNDAMMQKN